MANTNLLVTVTGASGFIALHCVRELLGRGYRVRGTVAISNDQARSVLGWEGRPVSETVLDAARDIVARRA